MSSMLFSLPFQEHEKDVPSIPPVHEPEPDEPEADDETQELVRPVKT